MGFVSLTELSLDIDSNSKPLWSIVVDEYRYVLYSTNKALVFKGDNKEPSYEITPIGCSCPGDRYNNNACKHRKIVSFLGDGSAAPPVEGTAVKSKQEKVTDTKSKIINDISESDLNILFE